MNGDSDTSAGESTYLYCIPRKKKKKISSDCSSPMLMFVLTALKPRASQSTLTSVLPFWREDDATHSWDRVSGHTHGLVKGHKGILWLNRELRVVFESNYRALFTALIFTQQQFSTLQST